MIFHFHTHHANAITIISYTYLTTTTNRLTRFLTNTLHIRLYIL